MRTIIIDDEKHCRRTLATILTRHHPDIDVVGLGENVKQGIELIKETKPELLFLDIEMPDGTGFDILKNTTYLHFHVIFTTNFQQYALTAIKFGALDYLLKPVDEEELHLSLEKVRQKKEKEITREQYQILMDTLQAVGRKRLPTKLAVPTSKGVHYKLVANIIRFEAARNYTEIILTDPDRNLLASINLGEYEQQFEPYSQFVRVHKSHLINLQFVATYVKADGGYLVLKNGDKIGVSRLYRDDLLRGLGEL